MPIQTGGELDLRSEIGRVAADFESVAGPVLGVRRSADAGVSETNLALALPYYLIEGFPFEGDVVAARAMSAANAFGAAHFLAQDRVLDGNERPAPDECEFSDVCMTRFVRGYAELFPADGAFWGMFDRYVSEYFESLRWERDVLWGDEGIDAVRPGALPATLRMLGRKMSPLKAAVAGIALLSGHVRMAQAGERIVEAFHAGYQLVDDLRDLDEDAGAGRWSAVLRMIALASGVQEVPANPGAEGIVCAAVSHGVHARVVKIACDQYRRAATVARELGLASLASHVDGLREAHARHHGWVGRRASIALAFGREAGAEPSAEGERVPPWGGPAWTSAAAAELARSANLHVFSVAGAGFVVDGSSGLFFEADAVARDVLQCAKGDSPAEDLDVVRMNYGAEVVDAALGELALLASPVPFEPPGCVDTAGVVRGGIECLALNVTGACNLSCDYCYLTPAGRSATSRMDEDTAFRAIDLLVDESAGHREMSLVFFGGEPLMEPGLVFAAAARARERAAATGRGIALHMTTNGTLLTPDVALALHNLGVRVLVSIDGPRGQHDRHRVFRSGGGSYDAVAKNLRMLPAGMRVSARSTVTPGSDGLSDVVAHLKGLGLHTIHLAVASGPPLSPEFERWLLTELEMLASRELEAARGGSPLAVGNFKRAMSAIHAGRPGPRACGAGVRYLCVAPDGTLYLCHRFAERCAFAVGDVRGGVDAGAVERALAELRGRASACGRCWARFLCAGPCLHDLAGERLDAPPDARRCSVARRTLELSMWLYTSLPGEARQRLDSEREKTLASRVTRTAIEVGEGR